MFLLQLFHLQVKHAPLIVEISVRFLSARPAQGQRHSRWIDATGCQLSTGFLAFGFLRQPAPNSLCFQPLRQMGTLLATGVQFRTEWGVFRGSGQPGDLARRVCLITAQA
jgi:hypothetical protein